MRLRNAVTGVIVNVRDGHPLARSSDWESEDKPKRTSKKTDEKSD